MISISDVRVRIVKQHEDTKLKAVASLIIDECFAIHDIKIISGNDGIFIAMPSRKTSEGEFKDIVHPINTETREKLKGIILAAYDEALKNYKAENETADSAVFFYIFVLPNSVTEILSTFTNFVGTDHLDNLSLTILCIVSISF